MDTDYKTCSSCKQVKLVNEFYRPKDSYCKKCILEMTRKNKKERQLLVYNYLLKHPCVDCGESNPIILQFDHIKDKNYNIPSMIGRFSKKHILEEIAKCEVRCGNCHRRKTAKDFNWFCYKFQQEEKNEKI